MESKKLSEFDDSWQLILDIQQVAEILSICEIFKNKAARERILFDGLEITGVVIRTNDGDILETWATESAAPYLLTSEYMPIDYWRNL